MLVLTSLYLLVNFNSIYLLPLLARLLSPLHPLYLSLDSPKNHNFITKAFSDGCYGTAEGATRARKVSSPAPSPDNPFFSFFFFPPLPSQKPREPNKPQAPRARRAPRPLQSQEGDRRAAAWTGRGSRLLLLPLPVPPLLPLLLPPHPLCTPFSLLLRQLAKSRPTTQGTPQGSGDVPLLEPSTPSFSQVARSARKRPLRQPPLPLLPRALPRSRQRTTNSVG